MARRKGQPKEPEGLTFESGPQIGTTFRHPIVVAETGAGQAYRLKDGEPRGQFPVQAWGLWRGLQWYFRARGDGWTWRCPDYVDPTYAATLPDGPTWYAEGDWKNSGCIEPEDARGLIARCLKWAESTPEGSAADLTRTKDPKP